MTERQDNQAQAQDFSGLGIAPLFLESLARLKYTSPTPIQRQAIPPAIEGKDIVGIAQTGTGKTMAFGIPMIQRLQQIKGRGLVVLPTRELAVQVEEALRRLGACVGLRTVVLIGGMQPGPQRRALERDPHIIIATPGRLNDFLDQRVLRLNRIEIVVLDEADRMFDMGFAPQIQKIFQNLPREKQTMLFSATMPPAIMRLATANMKLPLRIEVAPAGTTAERVTQEIFIVPKDSKVRLVEKLLQQYSGPTLIFTRTKHGATKLTRAIHNMEFTVTEIHSNRSIGQRRNALEGFKTGRYRILVATDIASRGIDVTGIELVINFDLPSDAEDYVHRIGRTARAGTSGHAISFVAPDQRREVYNIERLVRKNIPISELPELPPARVPKSFDNKFVPWPDQSSARPYAPRSEGVARHQGGRAPSGGGHRYGRSRPHGSDQGNRRSSGRFNRGQ